MSDELKIISARIEPSNAAKGKYEATVFVKVLENGPEEKLFSYFDDELSFSEKEFVGLTRPQAHERKFKKDVAYLRS